jgi:hypothetical protein
MDSLRLMEMITWPDCAQSWARGVWVGMRMLEELVEETRRAVAASLHDAFEAGGVAAADEAKRRVAALAEEIGPAGPTQGPKPNDEATKGERTARTEGPRHEGQSYCGAGDAARGFFISPLGVLAFFALAALAIWRWTLF